MKMLVNGATLTVQRFKHSPHIGALLTPNAKNSIRRIVSAGLCYGVDNGAASSEGFSAPAFLRLLSKVAVDGRDCLFVAAPDVVKKVGADYIGDAAATLEQFAIWAPMIRSLGLPAALVAQDGLHADAVPWDQLDALFVGGSTRFKLAGSTIDLCRDAKRHGKYVHVGRVNSLRRIKVCVEMRADSFDGSHFTWWPDSHIPIGLRWIAAEKRQGLLT